MTEIKLNNDVTVSIYNSIKELPIELGKKFNHFILQNTGIGNTIEDIDDHLARLIEFVKHDKKDETIEEIKNLRFNMFSMLTEWDYNSAAFTCLIHSINDVPMIDRSDEGIEKAISYLSSCGLTNEKVSTIIEDVKKKLLPKSNFISRNTSQTIGTT